MDADSARAYLLGKPEAIEDFPFGADVHVFKIHSKMFGTLGWKDRVARINLKCDPDEAAALRDLFESVVPGYHMNKLHWNTVLLNGNVPTSEVERMIDISYELVVRGLKKAIRQGLEIRHGAGAVDVRKACALEGMRAGSDASQKA